MVSTGTTLGHRINREKTSLFFSKKRDNDTKEAIKNFFGAQVIK